MYRLHTDVVIPPITMYAQINPDELWIAFGSNCTLVIYMPIHEVVRKLDPSMCKTLPVSMYLVVVTVSACGGKRKKTAWNA